MMRNDNELERIRTGESGGMAENVPPRTDSSEQARFEETARSLPPGVAIGWGLVKEPQRGPKREMSIKSIVEAAVAIADKDGLQAVTMQRVAKSLGFTAMSLYRYIPSKDDLLLLMQEQVADIPIPPERPESEWREELRDYFRVVTRIFTDHPWMGDVPITSVPMTPNQLRFVNWLLRAMRHFDITDYEKMSFVLLISSYARSWGIIARDYMLAMQSGSAPESFSGNSYSDAIKQLIDPEQYPYLAPVIMSGTYLSEHDAELEAEFGMDFEFGLERVLDGIEQYIASRTTKRQRPETGV